MSLSMYWYILIEMMEWIKAFYDKSDTFKRISYLDNTTSLFALVSQSCHSLRPQRGLTCQAPLSMGFSRQEYWSG